MAEGLLLASPPGALIEAGLRFLRFRQFMRAADPVAGTGPGEETMDDGWFRLELAGLASEGRTAGAPIADKDDPGNRVTVTCQCESAPGPRIG